MAGTGPAMTARYESLFSFSIAGRVARTNMPAPNPIFYQRKRRRKNSFDIVSAV
jgi:hypothetical protein